MNSLSFSSSIDAVEKERFVCFLQPIPPCQSRSGALKRMDVRISINWSSDESSPAVLFKYINFWAWVWASSLLSLSGYPQEKENIEILFYLTDSVVTSKQEIFELARIYSPIPPIPAIQPASHFLGDRNTSIFSSCSSCKTDWYSPLPS